MRRTDVGRQAENDAHVDASLLGSLEYKMGALKLV